MGLQELWFVIIAFYFTGYFVLEGFDFGVGMLLPVLGRGKDETANTRRRVMINTIGPIWDANEVWLIVGGAAIFAAFPEWYATLFSGFYLPLLLILLALIVRVCAIEYRSKVEDEKWRRVCDWGIGIGSWVPAVLWGVAFANIVRGVDINAESEVTSGFFDLLNPYALLGGVTFGLVFALHGAVYLALKTGHEMQEDAQRLAARLAIPTVPVAAAFALWTQFAYGKGWTWIPLLVAAGALVAVVVLTRAAREGWAFMLTCVAIISVGVLLFGSLFPNVMPSTLDPAYNLTIENASSTHYTLTVMTWAAVIMSPVVLAYQAWTYWVFRQRISMHHIPKSIGLPLRQRP